MFALPLLLLIGGAIAVSVYKNHDAPLSVAVIGAGIFSFIFFYTRSGSQPVGVQPEGGLREAIAAAIIIEYIALVGIVAFFKKGPDQLPAISQAMIANFTTVVGIVVAFYFGSSAYLQASGH